MEGDANPTNFQTFLTAHEPQLHGSGVPEHFWESLYNKLINQVFDAGDAFSLLLLDYGEEGRNEFDPVWTVAVSKPNGIQVNDVNAIYLIDHAWTFRMDSARRQLQQIPGLIDRMAIIMGVDKENETEQSFVEKIMTKLWRYNCMYTINAEQVSVENRMPIWYIMDELGSGILHSDTPNFRMVPFVHLPEKITYSLLFPIKNCEEGEQVTRDFVENLSSKPLERNALLLTWKYYSFLQEDYIQTEPDEEYFLSGHIEETLPSELVEPPFVDSNRPLKVFSEYKFINQYLNDTAFEIVCNENDADILWYTNHFKGFFEFSQTSPNKFINQFPFENVITIKDLLGIVCRRTIPKHLDEDSLVTYPKWFPTTYNLNTELVKFASYFQHRAQKGLDNHWICKPWNLARSLDTHITKDIAHIMRLPATGPKIAQKYVEKPVLFYRPEVGGKVKFDIRYVILLKNVEPLEAYIYSNFFLRFSNKPFDLSQFDDYEKHFTVMNYADNFQLRHLPCAEFLKLWSEQYPDHNWENIETDICEMLKEMLIGATYKKPPCGIGANPQSRSLYAADIILSWDNGLMQPKLLEVNWMPDCKRACEYYPDFYNDIFKLLFLNLINTDVFRCITD